MYRLSDPDHPSDCENFYTQGVKRMGRTVLGLDVGHGYTKLSYRDNKSDELVMRAFRSLASRHTESEFARTARNTRMSASIVTVEVDGAKFDVDVSEHATIVRRQGDWNESSDFPQRPEYRALIHAAVASTGLDHIDVLVAGLPVHTFQRYKAEIDNYLRHTISWERGQVTIGEVHVIPQPVGAMITLQAAGQGNLAGELSLLIDVGSFTTDWVVSRDLIIDFDRSGGRPGGASHIYRSVAEGLSAQMGEPFEQLNLIEQALRTGEPLRVYGAPVDLRPHQKLADQAALETVRAMQARLGGTQDLTFLLAGGGGHLYRQALAEVFPRNRVVELEDPRYRNVVGFVLFGEQGGW
ncbi:PRTRC system protein D [Paraburkholderia sp. J7]|uniref:PRTRC system protein D n=1 Tax=Paraburkholderia sp. J7 TaxID=2805438 RepID=UPI002AB6B477|nr:PRTRC system protein D [Paraburkholderia sp. J7]